MAGLDLIKMMGALAFVLGGMVGMLWAVRRTNLVPGGSKRATYNRMEVVERLSIDQKRSAVLIRLDNLEHLVVLSPEGALNVTAVSTEGREEKPSRAERRPEEGSRSFASIMGDVVKHAGLVRPKGGEGA